MNINTDYGPMPFVVDIENTTLGNDTYRTAVWTGDYLQVTVMSIPVGGDIGLEMHDDTDQFIRIESGQGVAQLGNADNNLYYQQPVFDGSAIFVPVNTWHNITNTGDAPLKLYSIYAPPHHPWGTVEPVKAED